MAKKGKIYFVDKDFTDGEVAEIFGYPCIFILKDNTGKLLKQTAYDLEGTKSMVEFKDSGSIKNYPTFADFPIPGDIATIYKALDTDELYIWDAETGTYLLSSIDDSWKNYVELSIGGLQNSIDGINEELVTIETRLDDLDDNDNSLQEQITAETTARQNADIAEANARTFADGVLDSKITAEKNRNDSQDLDIASKQDKITKRNLQSGNINYCGFALFGSAESDPVWTITKITVAGDGSITKTISNNVAWTSVPF